MNVAGGEAVSGVVWDWPTRLFHWLLVLAIIVLFVTANLGGNWMEWHKRTGFVVLGLVLFRLAWGFVGGYHARFVNFVRGPRTIINYLRGNSAASPGAQSDRGTQCACDDCSGRVSGMFGPVRQ